MYMQKNTYMCVYMYMYLPSIKAYENPKNDDSKPRREVE